MGLFEGSRVVKVGLTEKAKQNLKSLLSNAPVFKPPLEPKASGHILLTDDLPDTVATAFEIQSPVTHHYNSIDGWSIYSDDKYQQVPDEKEIQLHLRKFVKKCGCKQKKFVRLKQTGSYIKDVQGALAADSKVHILPSKKAPCSFNNALNPETTVALKNGLMDLSDVNNPVMKPFTPNFYTFNYLPVAYEPGKPAPDWLNLLGYYFTEEDVNIPDKIAQDVLHSWMFRWFLRIMYPHKICALIGEPRSGKSTIGRITTALIGQTNVSSITIASLSGSHGLYGLMNKQLGIMWDAKVVGRAGDIAKAVEVMKNISGQDNITVNPKNRDTIDLQAMKLNILMIANEVADLRDDTGALASRFTFLQTTQNFLGQENPIFEKNVIDNELSGILNLILAAPKTIIEHPKSDITSQEFVEMSSPYAAFANDYCDIGDTERFVPVDFLWAYYCDWCETYKHKAPSAQLFKIKFFSAIRGLKKFRPRINDEQFLALETEHKLDQRPGPKLILKDRPRCYRGIDIIESLKGEWIDHSGQGRSSYGQGWSE